MSTVATNKLKVKDIITVVLLALINVVIFFASSLLYATPITIILMPVFFALLEGVIYFMIGTKVKKPGACKTLPRAFLHMGAFLCRRAAGGGKDPALAAALSLEKNRRPIGKRFGTGFQLEIAEAVLLHTGVLSEQGCADDSEHHIVQVADIRHIISVSPLTGKNRDGTQEIMIPGEARHHNHPPFIRQRHQMPYLLHIRAVLFQIFAHGDKHRRGKTIWHGFPCPPVF